MNSALAGARTFLLLAALLPSFADAAPIKSDEGFATRLTEDADHNPKPVDVVTHVNAGQGAYYWIKWKNYPNRTTVRCVITDSDGDIAFDDNYIDEDNPTDQYTVCGGETDAKDFDAGKYTFVQYLDGEKVGEQAITIDRAYTFKISRYKKMKWTFAAIILAAMAALWLYRKTRGDHAGAADVFKSKSARRAEKLANDPVVIGAKLAAGAGAGELGAAKVSDEEGDLAKAQKQFQSAMALPDKKMGVEAGKRYLSLLLKARRGPEAVGIFKACLAADPAFRVAQPEEVLPLAKAARAAGDPAAAVAALRGFDKAYPGHALIPDVYVFSAQLMAEDLKNVDMAKKILAHVVAKYPGHHLAQEARRYLQTLPA